MDFFDDIDSIFQQTNEINHDEMWDFPLSQSTPASNRCQSLGRPVDFPSLKKHYGLMSFFDTKYPIIYRLINDNVYIPYIRLTHVFQILHHPMYKNESINVKNLPVVEMTSVERVYYKELSSFSVESDWTNEQLLSVAILDGIIAIVNLTRNFNEENFPPSDERCKEWRDALNRIRQEARNRWMLEEKCVLQRIHDQQSTCIISNTLAKRRSYFEERLNLSIVDESGGFIQIDSFIYPYVKDFSTNQIYLRFNDLRQHLYSLSLLKETISLNDQYSSIVRAYNVVVEQAQTNLLRYGRRNDLSKYLPEPNLISENENDRSAHFVTLETIRSVYQQRHRQHLFIQLFENASIEEIQNEYKTNLARQFIFGSKRKGGLIHRNVPCLLSTNGKQLWIPSNILTRRRMTQDERLFLNLMLLYRGWWKDCLSKKKCWFLKEMINEQENLRLQILFDNQRTHS